MKKIITLAGFVLFYHFPEAQILKKIMNKTIQKTEDKISEKVSDKASDAATKPVDDNADKNNTQASQNKKNEAANHNVSNSEAEQVAKKTASSASLATYSKFDFVPGEKILVYEDFSKDAKGDFPNQWNTNGSGEIVTIEGQEGNWFMVNKKGKFIPEFITSLPENFTFEFDLICNEKFSFYSDALSLYFATGGEGKSNFDYRFLEADKRSGLILDLHPTNAGSNGGLAKVAVFQDGAEIMQNTLNTTQFNSNAAKTKIKVSIWRQKQRLRMYLNEEKVFDLPRAFVTDKKYQLVMFELANGMSGDNDKYLISNMKLAVGAPDTRNKLITEGKFSTTGILFDVNSDKIKPESYGVLKDIADVLKENSDVKIKIIGHTDSDGDEKMNLELSKKRAAAVQNALIANFSISESRIQTDGMGESKPVADNNTPSGKANNRRVEFIKM